MDFQGAAFVIIVHIGYYAERGELVSIGSPAIWLSELTGYREAMLLSIQKLATLAPKSI
jgi:hypothetical protein